MKEIKNNKGQSAYCGELVDVDAFRKFLDNTNRWENERMGRNARIDGNAQTGEIEYADGEMRVKGSSYRDMVSKVSRKITCKV